MNNQLKLRVIRPAQPERGYKEIYGITIPNEIAVFFKDAVFTINKTNNGIELISGTNFKDQKNIEVDLEQYRV